MFKVLIAEDDGDLRQLFQHVLIQNGYFVKGVCNGKEGLEELEKAIKTIKFEELYFFQQAILQLCPCQPQKDQIIQLKCFSYYSKF